jgi:hypothetical protein
MYLGNAPDHQGEVNLSEEKLTSQQIAIGTSSIEKD